MKQHIQSVTIIVLLLLLTTTTASACSPAPIIVTLNCRNGGTETTILERATTFIANLPPSCDIGADKALLTQAIQVWRDTWKGYFRSESLRVIPYNPVDEQEAQRETHNVLTCRYIQADSVGNWLFLSSTSRDYCYLDPFISGGMCPGIRLSLTMFIVYVLTHISPTTLPYLAMIIVVISIIIRYIQKLQQKGHIRCAFKPRIRTIIATFVIASILNRWFVATPLDLVCAIIAVYFLISSYTYHRSEHKRLIQQ